MIEPMKKITLLCLGSDKVRTLEALRDLLIMHTVVSANTDTADVAALSRRLAEVNRAGLALLKSKAKSSAAPVEAEKAVARINDILDERAALEKEIDSLNKECERLLVIHVFKSL